MPQESPKSLPVIGFLSVVENAEVGLCGGYLLLNQHGRPLEFHCTAPVKANRAQEILYGPTLAPYLYGEQIGQTLFTAAKQTPLVVCTNVDHVLALRDFVSIPVVLVEDSRHEPTSTASQIHRIDQAHPTGQLPPSRLNRFHLGDHELAVSNKHEADRQTAQERLGTFVSGINFTEPFCRIHDAIREALQGAK